MKNLVAAFLMGSLIATSSFADTFDSDSLIGIEAGGSWIEIESTDGSLDHTFKPMNLGFKVGAETESYRAFLDIHTYESGAFDSLVSYGGEIQYLANLHQYANFFMGAGAGMIDIELTQNDVLRQTSKLYISGGAGFNFHVLDQLDLDIGARYLYIDAKNTRNSVTYKYDQLITAYGSLIYKFQID